MAYAMIFGGRLTDRPVFILSRQSGNNLLTLEGVETSLFCAAPEDPRFGAQPALSPVYYAFVRIT